MLTYIGKLWVQK